MKSTKDSEAKIAYKMGQSWGSQIMAVAIGILLTMAIVWLTMPSSEERLINKKCFKECKVKVERQGHTMSFLSSRDYIEAIKVCHKECASILGKGEK
tara:strand:+ start:1159 stop:1449 length:291 start_codon:yes stop_codon:yes gene_type:complete